MNFAMRSRLLWPAKELPFSASAGSPEEARRNRYSYVRNRRTRSSPRSGLIQQSRGVTRWAHFDLTGLLQPLPWSRMGRRTARETEDRLGDWTGWLESRSLEESFRVDVPVASSFVVFARSEQIAYSLRLSGDSSQPSSSTIRLSEHLVSALLYSTLT